MKKLAVLAGMVAVFACLGLSVARAQVTGYYIITPSNPCATSFGNVCWATSTPNAPYPTLSACDTAAQIQCDLEPPTITSSTHMVSVTFTTQTPVEIARVPAEPELMDLHRQPLTMTLTDNTTGGPLPSGEYSIGIRPQSDDLVSQYPYGTPLGFNITVGSNGVGTVVNSASSPANFGTPSGLVTELSNNLPSYLNGVPWIVEGIRAMMTNGTIPSNYNYDYVPSTTNFFTIWNQFPSQYDYTVTVSPPVLNANPSGLDACPKLNIMRLIDGPAYPGFYSGMENDDSLEFLNMGSVVGQPTITVTIKDPNGNPVPDGLYALYSLPPSSLLTTNRVHVMGGQGVGLPADGFREYFDQTTGTTYICDYYSAPNNTTYQPYFVATYAATQGGTVSNPNTYPVMLGPVNPAGSWQSSGVPASTSGSSGSTSSGSNNSGSSYNNNNSGSNTSNSSSNGTLQQSLNSLSQTMAGLSTSSSSIYAEVLAILNQLVQILTGSSASSASGNIISPTMPNNNSSGQSTFSYTWNTDLSYGMYNNADVSALQQALTLQGLYTGPVNGNFLSMTQDAVVLFQQKYGISGTGYVGTQTRAELNALYGGTGTSTGSATTTTGTNTSSELACSAVIDEIYWDSLVGGVYGHGGTYIQVTWTATTTDGSPLPPIEWYPAKDNGGAIGTIDPQTPCPYGASTNPYNQYNIDFCVGMPGGWSAFESTSSSITGTYGGGGVLYQYFVLQSVGQSAVQAATTSQSTVCKLTPPAAARDQVWVGEYGPDGTNPLPSLPAGITSSTLGNYGESDHGGCSTNSEGHGDFVCCGIIPSTGKFMSLYGDGTVDSSPNNECAR